MENETFLCKRLDLVHRSLWMRERRWTPIMIMLDLLCSWLGWFIGTCLGQSFLGKQRSSRGNERIHTGTVIRYIWRTVSSQICIEWGSQLSLRIKKFRISFYWRSAPPFCLELKTFEIHKNLMPFSSHKICQRPISDILSFFDKQ